MVLNRERRLLRPRLSFKITTPYVFLSIALGLTTVFLAARMQASVIRNQFSRQLSDAGQRVYDSVVRQEEEHITHVRAIAHMAGLPGHMQQAAAGARDQLELLVLPYAATHQIERVVVLDMQGQPLWAGRRNASDPTRYDSMLEGAPDYRSWSFVASVLQQQSDQVGDKYVGLGHDQDGAALYTVGPIFEGEQQVGVIMIGSSLQQLVQRWREITLADVTIYDQSSGAVLATSLGAGLKQLDLSQYRQALNAGQEGMTRPVQLDSRTYSELVGPLVVRGKDILGAVGVALRDTGVVAQGSQQSAALLGLFGMSIVGVIVVGLWLTRRIVTPISELVRASEAVATGDLSQQLAVRSQDELGDLTTSFNVMVAGLRERERMRDILGRFVSPTIAELVLQRPLDLSGELRLLSILFTDLRDFTGMSEQEDPAELVRTLNEYFGVVVDAAERHRGLVNKFGGDSTLVIFGLTENDPTGAISARAALAAALDIREQIARVNERRLLSGRPAIQMGIGINTGHAVAGLVGAQQRMEYTVIGDAVNLSSRIQALSRELGGDILISARTYVALGRPADLEVTDLGWHHIKGKKHMVRVFSVLDWQHQHA